MNATTRTSQSPVVEVQGLSKQYGSGPAALDGVDLRVPEKQMLILLGHSGAGKSTLLRHINGLERPGAGSVHVLGKDVTALRGRGLRELRGSIGMIFQQFDLVGSLSSVENVMTGALGRLRGPRLGVLSYGRRLRDQAFSLLDEVGMLDRAHQRADTLSGGQQQRVAIARALMQQPRLLLADEPVASLDPESSRQIMTLLHSIRASHGLTVVCSLHQVSLALEWGERVVGMRAGRIVLDKPAGELTVGTISGLYQGSSKPGTETALEPTPSRPSR
ncbi:phosphonate ABC transporter ATP-binding protein [Streptomyces shenzhenensis]|uniref:phosphonate ABC transporter ATP-binding protein n=1 Tax=Streptomyces shenzhenensis TaxID=943815 RepID=UPI0033C75674